VRINWNHGEEFSNLSPRQQNDLMFAHTIGRLDFELPGELDVDINTDDYRKLSPRQKRLLMIPVGGGAIGTNLFAAAGLTTSITTYTAGDSLGTEVTWTNMAIAAGKSGTILSACVFDYAKVTGAINYFFGSAALAGVGADNAAWTITDTTTVVGMIPFPTPYASALNSFAEVTNLGLSYTTTTTSSLFGDGVTLTANAVFGAATDLKYSASVLYD
jgi:hypothetical protein